MNVGEWYGVEGSSYIIQSVDLARSNSAVHPFSRARPCCTMNYV